MTSGWSSAECRAVDKFFSLGVLTFTTHYKQLCAVAMCYRRSGKFRC